MSITYKPKNRRRHKVHGFRKRMASIGGRRILSKRRNKKRWKLTV